MNRLKGKGAQYSLRDIRPYGNIHLLWHMVLRHGWNWVCLTVNFISNIQSLSGDNLRHKDLLVTRLLR